MKNLAELHEHLRSKIAEAKAIDDVAKDGGRALTEDEMATLNPIMEDINSTKDKIHKVEASERLSQTIRTHAKGLSELKPSKTQLDDASLEDSTLTVKPAWEGRKDKGFNNGMEFFYELLSAQQGREFSERLHACCANSDVPSTLADPTAGVLVPEAFVPNELRVGYDNITSLINTFKIPMGAPTVELPSLVDNDHRESVSGGFLVTRKSQGHAVAVESTAEYEKVRLTAKSLFGFSAPTRELLTDSIISFAAIINRGMGEEFDSRLMEERIRGDGIGQYLGILESPAFIAVPKGTTPAQGAETIIFENIAKVRERMWGYSNCVWMANQDTISQLILLNHPSNAAMPIWIPSARPDIPDILFGRPLIFTEHASSIGNVGDLMCVNWTQYLEGTLQGIRNETSLNARFIEHLAVFKFWMRNDGCPWWKSTLKPKHGKNELSPFAGLAERK